MSNKEVRVLLGNDAIARGLVESGCQFIAAYPGTPSSEILPGVVRFKKENHLDIYIEWSTNEKVAFENALVASYTGKRTAVAMKQVGLNVATDPLMSAAYIGTVGGFRDHQLRRSRTPLVPDRAGYPVHGHVCKGPGLRPGQRKGCPADVAHRL